MEVGQITGDDDAFVEQVRLLRDGKRLLTTCMDGKARLRDLATGRQLRALWHPGGLRPAAIHPHGRRVEIARLLKEAEAEAELKVSAR